MSGLQLDRPVGGLTSRQVGRQRERLAVLTRADTLHRWHLRSPCQGTQPFGRGSCRRCVDGRVQSRMHLKRFWSGTVGIALPLLDFGSAHKPGKTEHISKLKHKRLQKQPCLCVDWNKKQSVLYVPVNSFIDCSTKLSTHIIVMNGSFVVSETACDLYLHTYNLQQKRNMTHLDKNSPFGFEATSYIFTIIKH